MTRPSKEMTTWVTILDDNEKPRYRIKSDGFREQYILFEVYGNKEVKTKYKAKDPTDLYEYCIL